MIRRLVLVVSILLLGIGSVGSAHLRIQDGAPADDGSIKLSPEELAAHDKVKNATTFDETVLAAKAFLEAYPQSPARANMEVYVYNQIVEGPADETRLRRIELFKSMFPQSERLPGLELTMTSHYIRAGKFADVVRVGEAYLAVHPNDVDTHYLLLRVAVDALRNKDTSLIASGKEHGNRAIELFKMPGLPERFDTDEEWMGYRETNLPLAYQSLGILALATEDRDSARTNFQLASEVNPKDPLNYFFLASMKEDEYRAVARQYNAIDEESRTTPEAVEMLERANVLSDEVISLLVKTLAFAEPDSELGRQARATLEPHYARRHDGSLEGIEEEIQQVRNGGRS